MVDIFSRHKRSKIMSKISSHDTKPEILVRKFLFSQGFRFRKNDNRYPGKPDIILPKYKIAIFIHGCFWHNHNCNRGRIPKTNTKFWQKKINDNKKRDKKNQINLLNQGWKVIVIWQCEINNKMKMKERLEYLIKEIRLSSVDSQNNKT
jgi:DNA mismatch endonuclease (patch repair protein)